MREDDKYFVDNNRKLEIQRKINQILKLLKVKIILFFIIELIIKLFYLYYITAFCEVFINTQILLVKDSISSFIISIPTSLITALILCIIYRLSLKYEIKLLYKCILFFVK